MIRESDKSEMLARFLRVATEKWGADRAEEMKSGLETTAEAIWKIQDIELHEEEPALTTAILERQNLQEKEERRSNWTHST